MTISTIQTAAFISPNRPAPTITIDPIGKSEIAQPEPICSEGTTEKSESTQNEPISDKTPKPAKPLPDIGKARSEKAMNG